VQLSGGGHFICPRGEASVLNSTATIRRSRYTGGRSKALIPDADKPVPNTETNTIAKAVGQSKLEKDETGELSKERNSDMERHSGVQPFVTEA